MNHSSFSTPLGRVAAFCVLVWASSVWADWQFLPAGSPSISTLATDSSGQKLFLGVQGAGFWKSENGGSNWTPASTAIRSSGHTALTSLYALDPAADTLICTAFRQGEDRWNSYSFDQGQTWQRFTDEYALNGGQFQVWNHGHNVWFGLNGGRFMRSTDYGQTWTMDVDFPPAFRSIAQDPLHDSTLFVGWGGAGIYHPGVYGVLGLSDDLGDSWYALSDTFNFEGTLYLNYYHPLRMSNGERTIVGYFQSFLPDTAWRTFYITGNNGLSWERVNLDFSPTMTSQSALIEDVQTPGRLFMGAGTVPGGVMRSDDYGRNWYPAGGGLPVLPTFAAAVMQNRYSGDIYAVVSDAGVYKSTNHGDSWQPVQLPPIGTAWGEFRALEEATFVQRPSEGRYWWQWELEAPFTAWHSLSLPTAGPDTTALMGPVIQKMGNQLVGCMNLVELPQWQVHSQMVTSTDDGQTWIRGPELPYALRIAEMSVEPYESGERIVAFTNDGSQVVTSTDVGITWSELLSPGNETYLYQVAQNGSAVAAYGSANSPHSSYLVYLSTDDGATWRHARKLEFNNLVLVGSELFGASGGYCVHLLDTTFEVRGALPVEDVSMWDMEVVFGLDTVLVGIRRDSTAVWTSDDLGWTWQERNFNLPLDTQAEWIINPTYDPYRERLWIASGVGVCYLDVAELSADGPLEFKPADYTLLSVYPNPFNAAAKIRYDLLKAQKVGLKIYDVTGRLVRTVADGMQAAGRHEARIEMGETASGVYFVRLVTPDRVRTEKVVLLK